MGKKNRCRDCKECRRRGLSKIVRGTVRVTAAGLSAGTTEIAARTKKGLLDDVCPICNHRMSLHMNKDTAVAD